MSLIHLLAVGRSLGTIRDHPSRYKMTQQNLLPRFGSAKDEGVEIMEQDGERSATETWAEAEEVQPAPGAGKNGKELANVKSEILEQSQSGAGGARGAAGMVRTAASPRKGWSLLGNPFRPKAAARGGGPIQAELALDLVRPVRNDLSDTDLEVVSTRKTGSLFISSGAGAKFEKVGKLLSRLRAGLCRFRTKQP